MTRESNVVAESPSTDLVIAAAMVDELEEYIINDDLYRTVILDTPPGQARVQMTRGPLLPQLSRIPKQRDHLSTAEVAKYELISKRAEAIIYSLKTRFNARLEREMKARLDSLKWYLDEALVEPVRGRANYPYEMRNRQHNEEIIKQLGDGLPSDLRAQQESVDRRLGALRMGSEFVWDASLRDVFPAQPYWYLWAGAK
jgi:hypothetical protein